MSSTNKTTYYDLPQFVDNDIFNPLVDDNDAYDKIDTALHNIADAEADDASEIAGVKSRMDSAEGAIDALEAQNGNSVLTTTAQTLSGAVNELDDDTGALNGRLDIVEDDINNVSTGLKAKVTSLENKPFVNEYNNVSSMVADTTITANTKCKTIGYYSPNDGGGCDYKISDTATPLSITLSNGLYAVPVLDVIDIKKLGAKGDGSECSAIIQKALDNSEHKPVYIPNGEYAINKPLYLYYGKVYGEDYTKTIIKASIDFANDDKFAVTTGVNGMLFVLNTGYGAGSETDDTTTGIEVKDIEFHCNSVCDYGVVFSLKTSRSLIERVMVRYSNVAGFIGHENMWLCKFIQCYVYYSVTGFDFLQNVKTSLYFDQCYVMSAEKGYSIKGDYSCLINCCADGITNIAYDLQEFKGTMVSCGCESTNALYIVKLFYSNVHILNATFFAPVTADSAVLYINGGSYVVANGRIYGDSTVCKSYKMDGVNNTLILNNIYIPSNILEADANIEPNNHVVILENNIVSNRGNITPFIGVDAQNDGVEDANAIFMGNTSAPFKMTNNRNYAASWNKRCNIGDVFLTKTPRDINSAGWMCAYDGSDDFQFIGTVSSVYGNSLILTAGGISGELNTGAKVPDGVTLYTESGIVGTVRYSTSPTEIVMSSTPANVTNGDTVYIKKLEDNSLSDLYLNIPIITFGNSGYRPSHPVIGSSYFDTQLGKPIWYTGSKWVDATGADA